MQHLKVTTFELCDVTSVNLLAQHNNCCDCKKLPQVVSTIRFKKSDDAYAQMTSP